MIAAGGARAQLVVGSFDILEDEVPLDSPHLHAPATSPDVLEELTVDSRQNHSVANDSYLDPSSAAGVVTAAENTPILSGISPEAKSSNTKIAWRAARIRRPLIESETFEPLDAVLEEPSRLIEAEETTPADSPQAAYGKLAQETEQTDVQLLGQHPLTALDADCNVQEQVEKHLAGQFEWMITYPAPAGSAANHGSQGEDYQSASESLVYGCNFLRRKQHASSTEHSETGNDLADSYAFLATPLKTDAYTVSGMDGSQGGVVVDYSQPPPYPGPPLKVPEVVTMVKEALSPSLSVVSEMSETFVERSAGVGPLYVPRIEDSLEELDKLEEQLEAVNAATLTGSVATVNAKPTKATPKTPAEREKMHTGKRATLGGQSATVRVKPSEKMRPSLRRSSSMTLRDKEQDTPSSAVEQKSASTLPRNTSTAARPSSAIRSPVKSTKPPTVPNFELPGEAVARRLKEQRDARQALQAEAQRAQAAPPRPRINRPLAKPTFELPGEAISRRKREERESKLRAEEEEEKKRREFKARPVRHTLGPTTLPRETVASRARQNRIWHDEAEEKMTEANKTKRFSVVGLARASASTTTTSGQSPQARGRYSSVIPATDSSRGASSSTSASDKRSTLSAEEIEQQRLRGKEILARDSIYAKDRVRDRRDRESTAKLARDQAAERSRVASREWAEKKRRRELAAKQAKAASEA